MMDEQRELDIRQYRESAAAWGERAARALVEGDEGAARTATRQAAKYARVAMRRVLKTGCVYVLYRVKHRHDEN